MSGDTPIYTFQTSHHAMWAEEVAREKEIPVIVVAAPASSEAKCGIALQTGADQASALEAALESEGILYQRG